MKSIPEGLNENFEVSIIGRESKVKRSHKINLKQIRLASNIFIFLLNVFNTFKDKGLAPNSITMLPKWYNPAGHFNNGLP